MYVPYVFLTVLPSLVVHLVVRPIADPWVVSMIGDQSHTFVAIDHEMFHMLILLFPLIQEGLSATSEIMCTKHWLTT